MAAKRANLEHDLLLNFDFAVTFTLLICREYRSEVGCDGEPHKVSKFKEIVLQVSPLVFIAAREELDKSSSRLAQLAVITTVIAPNFTPLPTSKQHYRSRKTGFS